MQILGGGNACSEFRLKKLLGTAVETKILSARFVYFVDLPEKPSKYLDESSYVRLCDLLDVSEDDQDSLKVDASYLVVVPRLGTKSPWSTKATDIIHRCGLEKVNRVERGVCWNHSKTDLKSIDELSKLLYDRMIDEVYPSLAALPDLFQKHEPSPLFEIPFLEQGKTAFEQANKELGLALADDEVDYLEAEYIKANKNPTDVELMMFAQVNSEHCRHKIFNASWSIDGKEMPNSLFGMVRETHKANPGGTLTAYADNSAVIVGSESKRFYADSKTGKYDSSDESVHIVCKVETHNHPTAISPFPGAATGSGGEIRDEGATGRGAKPKAGLSGFSVSHLRIPGYSRPWEREESKPDRIASPLQIMLDGPLGGAAFNNEFGRPGITGYFRNFEHQFDDGERRGYHKPIMLAGGLGNIRKSHVAKNNIPPGSKIIVIGGPAMLIGLGGGAASSVASGTSAEQLDFASVQRGNPEMQRRCQEVIDRCWEMGDDNPIISIHDVGAGGLSNALPELVADSDCGAQFNLRKVLNDEPGMSPMQIWCNESQERYTLAIAPEDLPRFIALCERERCLYCVVGVATEAQHLSLADAQFADAEGRAPLPIDLEMQTLFGNPPRMHREALSTVVTEIAFDSSTVGLKQSIETVLRFPAVADKTFLITIGDRSVTGMIHRDQMVGPWQVPVADVAVTNTGFYGYTGEAMAIGERTPLAVLNGPASGRIAVGELLTNMIAADIRDLSEVKVSANWMVASGYKGDDAILYEMVEAVTKELCVELGISIPVGKDSMSMRTVWQEKQVEQAVTGPVSLIVSGFSPVSDVRNTLTPWMTELDNTILILLSPEPGQARLGGSVLAQTQQVFGNEVPDISSPARLKRLLNHVLDFNRRGLLLAYHDRSDGGLLATLCEMAFASRCGLNIDLLSDDVIAELFNEELGMVMQVRRSDLAVIKSSLIDSGDIQTLTELGSPATDNNILISHRGECIYSSSRQNLHRAWSETTWQMQRMRDNPECADQEYQRILDDNDPGLYSQATYDLQEDICAPYINVGSRPAIAILREQGVNSHVEMGAAFTRAGFDAYDVTMSDLLGRHKSLSTFAGLVACGGFSFGDVLGAGQGWAKSILFNDVLRIQFEEFFSDRTKFALGVCNGCQMMSALKEIIPGASSWPNFLTNRSEQFEGRQVMVEVMDSPSILLRGMVGSRIPVAVAHGEGNAVYKSGNRDPRTTALRFVDNQGNPTEVYPYNPNGSIDGVTGVCNDDGRITVMMPHPERVFRAVSNSWSDPTWGEDGPWVRMFKNSRVWLD
ncbi:MAG: phosphoribosylformylglycinamidine synthase [Arenicellaceae bacterium]|nr:phosphoribosylformylglycinamidine synthase [Arenicellaceae bacterium]